MASYWDATGAERSQPLVSANGWTIERQSLATGCQLACRQNELGFALRLIFAVSGDALTVSVPADAISENGAARLKMLRLLPRFGAAREGDERIEGHRQAAEGVFETVYSNGERVVVN